MSKDTRIIIADDHPIVRKGLRQIIEADLDLEVVGEADDGAAAVKMILELAPSIALLDVDMPKMDGFAVAREIRERGLATKVIFLTIHSEADIFQEAMDIGALGYVLKDSAVFEIVGCIKAVNEGRYFVTPTLSGLLIETRKPSNNGPFSDLTPTELRIARLISEYKSNKEIADALFVHYRTVENHRANICQKLGLRGHNALLKFVVENKADLG